MDVRPSYHSMPSSKLIIAPTHLDFLVYSYISPSDDSICQSGFKPMLISRSFLPSASYYWAPTLPLQYNPYVIS